MSTWEEYLTLIYYDPKHPGSFQGPEKLYWAVRKEGKFRISKAQIQEWLMKQEVYTVNRFVTKKFKRSRVIVAGINDIWDSDLMDMRNLAKYNLGINYVLVAIDIFSRYLYIQPLKTKHGKEIITAFEAIIKQGSKPNCLRSDAGSEYTSHEVEKYFKSQGIHHYVTHNETQANYAERVIKTIKSKIYKYIVHNQTRKYIDQLQNIVDSYNSTKHSSLNLEPKNVNKSNEAEVRLDQYLIRNRSKQVRIKSESKDKPRKRAKRPFFKYKVGQTVRISYTKQKFDRAYSQKYSTEIFKVVQQLKRDYLPIYKLKDLNDEAVQGTFYESEIVPVTVDQDTIYKIDKVLKHRNFRGQKQVLVKWQGYSSKFNTWIPASEVLNYENV